MNDRKLSYLIEAHLDGRLTEPEAEQLSRALADDPEARRQFWEHAALHGLTQEAARLEWLGTASPKVERAIISVRPWRLIASLAAVAAVLAFLVVIYWIGKRPTERLSDGVAVLSLAVDPEWIDEAGPHAQGEVLSPGMLRLKSGAALIEFYSGARVAVEGPVEFQLLSAWECFLQSGRITAHVPPQAKGFKVGSPKLDIIDFGTDFGCAVLDNKAVEVHVFAGEVKVAPANVIMGGRSLKDGEAVRFDAGSWLNLQADRVAFLGEAELARREVVRARQRYAAWRDARRALSADPGTIIHYSFEGRSSTERIVTNRIADATPESHGSIVACTWAEGRWPDKGSLSFCGEGDRVRLTVAQPLQKVTLMAWVCIDALPHPINSLLSADTDQTGALRWEIAKDGRMRLGIARDLGHRYADWEVVQSEPVVTPDQYGQWLLLVTIFNGAKVCHYCNGRLVGSGNSFRPPALLIGTADVGNKRGRSPRNLSMRMDEFVILNYTMKPENVLNFYQGGQP